MIVFISLFIAVTVAIAALVLAPRLGDRRVVFSAAPDHPRAFGPDMTWLAIRTEDSAPVAAALGLHSTTPANWNSGIGTVYAPDLGQHRVFVSAPIDGWVFAIGTSLPLPHGRLFTDKFTPFLLDLSERFHEVHYFASHPEIDLYAWARMAPGKIVRAFAVGEQGVILRKGRPTREERALGLTLFELRGVRGRKGDAGGELLMHPTQEHVIRLAGQWSLNPTLLDTLPSVTPGLGLIGIAPTSWRAERLKQSA